MPRESQPFCAVSIPLPDGSAFACSPEAWAQAWSGRPGFFWFDDASASAGERWSFLGCEPVAEVRAAAGGGMRALAEAWRDAAPSGVPPLEGAPPFRGGWVAVLAYDLGREIERLPERARDDLDFPALYLARHDVCLAYHHASRRWWAACLVPVAVPPADRVAAARDLVQRRLASRPSPAPLAPSAPPAARTLRANVARAAFVSAVARALEYIGAGDCYQVNLAQRLECAWPEGGWALYRRLRAESPAPYGAAVRISDGAWVASISPELFLRVRGREAVTRPIKGTRPRGATPEADARLRAELEASAKDRAELTMIVDLERNDLGKVCVYGSVRVDSAGDLEAHPTVHHRVATVRGTLLPGSGPVDWLRALFPGGSVTGAPKIRAAQIIEELEPVRRGPYCGAIGWLGADGDLEFNLAIRTALVDERRAIAYYHAGAGIVADSAPDAEYDETLAKAAAFARAVNGSLPPTESPACP